MGHKITVEDVKREVISTVLASHVDTVGSKQLRFETVGMVGGWGQYIVSSFDRGIVYEGTSLAIAVEAYNEL